MLLLLRSYILCRAFCILCLQTCVETGIYEVQIFFYMKDRASYTAEEKLAIVKVVLSRKRSIQDIAKEKGIAATLISLWKKQAEDAMVARFQPQPKGRRKVEKPVEVITPDTKSLKNDVRKAKIKAAHLDASLKESKKRVAVLEQQLGELCSALGYKMIKARKPRKPRKA